MTKSHTEAAPPTLAKERIDIALPSCTKLNTDKAEPLRRNDLTLNEDQRLAVSTTESLWMLPLAFNKPIIDTPEPHRKSHLTDIEEPMKVESNVDKAEWKRP